MLFGAMNFPIRPILIELEAISKLKFDYLELTMEPPQAHYLIVSQQKEALLKALDRLKMGLICHLPSFVNTADLTESLRDASLQELLKSLQVAAELRSSKVVLHPSYFGGLSLFVMDKARQYAMKGLKTIVEMADDLDLTLCIENMFPSVHSLMEPDDFVDIFDRFPTLKMTLDTGHAHIGDKGGRRCVAFIEKYPDRIEHIHASDNFGKEDNHIPVSTGTVNFPEIIKALKGIGYDKTITLEIFSSDRDYVRISRDKLAAMFDAP